MNCTSMRASAARSLAYALAALLVACGGGGGGGEATPPPAPVLSVFAGSLQSAGSRDGVGIAAQFNRPGGVAQDAAGTVYVADTGNHTIRRITRDGIVTTIAGTAGQAGSADGTGAAARLSSPRGLALDATGHLYIADTGNNAVRKISAAGVVTTVATVDAPTKVAVDGRGVVYVLSDAAVHKLAADGSVTVFPVQPRAAFAGLRFSGIAVDAAGNVFLAEFPTTGSVVVSGDSGAIRKFDPQGQPLPFGTAADGVLRSGFPTDIAIDSGGNLYTAQNGVFVATPSIAFYYRNILKIAPDGSTAVLAGPASQGSAALTVDGAATAARFADPRAVSVGTGGRVVMIETATSAVRVIDAQGTVSTWAGGNGTSYRDGTGTEVRFSAPQGVAAGPDGSLYVVESGNRSLRKISAAGAVTTVRAPETLSSPAQVAVGANGAVYVTAYRSSSFCLTPTPYLVEQIVAAGSPTLFSASYNGSESARAIAVDAAGNVIVNERAERDPGVPIGCGGVDFGKPAQISLLAADRSKRVLASGIEARALAADAAGLVYFATAQGTVGSLNPTGETQSWAGAAGQLGDADGVGANARFRSLTALAVDAAGNLYVADGTRIRRVSPNGTVSTIADLATLEGVVATSAIPGLAWSAGALYATVRNAVIKIAPVN